MGDETYVWIAGRWMYLFRAVDSRGETVISTCRRRGIVKQPRPFSCKPCPIVTTSRHGFSVWTEIGATRQLFVICKVKTNYIGIVSIGHVAMQIIGLSRIAGR
jgi:hypothetical protein